MRNRRLPYAALALGATIALSGGTSASAATGDQQLLTSSNWAGYEAATSSGGTFSRVAGSWTEPSADCSSGDGDSAFWVGLGGGGGESSTGLEQVGTEIDCSSGSAQAHAWYELIPAAPVRLDVDIHTGDQISAWVSVDGHNVTVSLSDKTTGQTATKNLTTDNIDVSTAEWIAEAPSACSDAGCQPVPLADFGKVGFTDASATAGGHTGSISDSQWTSAPLQLAAADGSSSGASPSSLSSDGSSFSVSSQSSDVATSDPSAGGGYGDGSGGYGDGSGGYGDGSGGYGDGSGGYGYGGGGYGDGGWGSGGYGYSPGGYGDSYGYGGGFSYGA